MHPHSFGERKFRPRRARGLGLVACHVFLVVALSLGCTGDIGGSLSAGRAASGGNDNGNARPSDRGAGGVSGNGGVAGSAPPMPAMVVAGRAPLRRLSRIEYDNTVGALLGDTTHPARQFEPDVISDGFTNNADTQNVGTSLAQQYFVAAEALAIKATTDLKKLLGCDTSMPADETPCLRAWVSSFGQRAWRRPLQTAEVDRLMGVYTAGRMSFDVAVSTQMVLETMLLSPHFLYRVERGGAPTSGNGPAALTSWEMASRLSYLLTGSMPDSELFLAAERDALRTPSDIAAHVGRLLTATTSPTPAQQLAQERTAQFFTEWMHLTVIDKMTKDAALFPEFSPELATAMKVETESFVKGVLFGNEGPGDLGTLLTASFTFATPAVAKLYGATIPAGKAGTAPVRISLDPKQRAGLLTQPALLATFAKADTTDPIHRGKFIFESLLCGSVPAPPVNADIKPPTITPGTTAKQRFEQHRADPACAGCHVAMDPIGLTLENYDALGRWRDREGTLPIDATGVLSGTDVDGPLANGIELARKLATSAQVGTCAVRQLFRFAFGRFESSEDEPTIAALAATFESGQRRFVPLAIALTQTPAFLQLGHR